MNDSNGVGAPAGACFIADIPDHAITNPFSLCNEKSVRAGERFEKYKHYIIPYFRDLHAVYSLTGHGFNCPVCDSYVPRWNSSRVLAHLASLKHLRVALGDELEECDKRDNRGIRRKHRIYSTTPVVETVIADVGSGLGE